MRKSIECKKEIKIRDELDSVSVARRRRRSRWQDEGGATSGARTGRRWKGSITAKEEEHGQVAKAEDRKRKKQGEEDDSPLLLLLAVWRVSRTANVPVMWASTVASTTSAR